MHTCAWLKRKVRLTCDVKSCVLLHCASKTPRHPSCFIPQFSAFLRPSLHSAPHRHRLHPTHYTTADWNQEYLLCDFAARKSVYLAKSLPHTCYEPNPYIAVSSEHIDNDLTTTVAASENFDGFRQQVAASGSSQFVPA